MLGDRFIRARRKGLRAATDGENDLARSRRGNGQSHLADGTDQVLVQFLHRSPFTLFMAILMPVANLRPRPGSSLTGKERHYPESRYPEKENRGAFDVREARWRHLFALGVVGGGGYGRRWLRPLPWTLPFLFLVGCRGDRGLRALRLAPMAAGFGEGPRLFTGDVPGRKRLVLTRQDG